MTTPLRYFDCNCEIGPRQPKDPQAPWRTEDVLADLDWVGIDGALVRLTLHAALDEAEMRRRLASEIAKAPGRLFPVWPAVPSDAGDFGPPAELVSAARDAGVRAVELCPDTYRFPMDTRMLAPLLRAIADAGLTLLVRAAELPPDPTGMYGALRSLCEACPGVPVVGMGFGWGHQRVIAGLLERCPSFHIELSRYQIHRGIETYTERFGPERLLFGTGAPSMSPGAARAYIDYAAVGDDAKAAIAGGNLRRLLGVEPDACPAPEDDDPIRAAARQGRPVDDSPVFDAHCHVLFEGGQGAGFIPMYDGDAKGLLETAARVGTRTTAMMSWSGPLGGDMAAGNDLVQRAARDFPGRVLGMAYANPTHCAREDLIAELRSRIDEQGFVGIKPYHRVGVAYDDPLWAPVWELAGERGVYCLMDVSGAAGGVEPVARIAERFPGTQFVIAHSGSSWGMARLVADAMKRRPNAWAELTYTSVTNGAVEFLATEGDEDRVLYGTDAPMRDPRPQFGWVAWAKLPLKARRKILGENYARLAGLEL